MTEIPTQVPSEKELKRAERFYTRLRARVNGWLEHNTNADKRVRSYLLLLPDLLALLIRLLRDNEVDLTPKLQMAAALAYVISPIDLIPDFLAPLGLLDDTVVIAFILNRVVKMMGEAGEAILWKHWEGEGDVLEQIQRVIQTADEVLNRRILGSLRRRFGQR